MKEYRIHVEELLDPLYRHGCRVFSVVGSGGKTTLIRQAAMHYARLYQVGVAASTKMCLPDGQWEYQGCPPAVVSSDGREMRRGRRLLFVFIRNIFCRQAKSGIWASRC